MKISGKVLAKGIYENIQKKLEILKINNIVPKLIIVKSSDIDAVNNYIGQKIKRGEKIGIKVEVLGLDEGDCKNIKQMEDRIAQVNKSSKNHGIIFQKPSHIHINEDIESLIDNKKDVDGFSEKSLHKSPVYRGVILVLEEIFNIKGNKLLSFLKTKRITVIGKGKTGGRTIIIGLRKDGYNTDLLQIIDSKTPTDRKKKYIRQADIIISAVGKQNPVDIQLFSNNMVLIDVGVHFDGHNKIKGDFNEEDIKDKVGYYTTTPGGIGVLTVSYLMDNVVNSAMKSIKN